MLQKALKVYKSEGKHTFAFLAELLSHAAETKLAAAHIERAFLARLFREAATFCMRIAVTPTLIVG